MYKFTFRIIIFMAAVTFLWGCQSAAPSKQLINSPEHQWFYDNWNLSQAVKVGNQLWLSGQVGTDPETGKVPESLAEQAELIFQKIEAILADAGATMADIVEITSYHIDISQIGEVAKVKRRFIPKDHPAWSAVGVSGLVRPEILLEIKVVAVVGAGAATQANR